MRSSPLLVRVERMIAAHRLWSPGERLIVAVSGGADSLAALGLLLDLRAARRPFAPDDMLVAHLDHGLRGKAGEADATWVAQLADSLGLRCITGRASVRERATRDHLSLEDAARRERYAFLTQIAVEHDARRIVTGHTLDDQAETVLMRLVRGAGTKGLAGMRPLRGEIARPLLEVRRIETEAYCAGRGWEPRVDSTNQNRRYLRNRIRLDLMPALEQLNPRIQVTLAQMARSLTGALAPAVAHRVYRRAWGALAADGSELGASHLLALEALVARGNAGDRCTLPGGMNATLGYESLIFARVGGTAEPTHDEVAMLSIPGAVTLGGWRVSAEVLDLPPGLDRPAQSLAAVARAGTPADVGAMPLRAYVDADRAGEPLSVRRWQPGDRFRPLGMSHEKKVQDYLTDAKVPRAMRRTIPLVVSPAHIIWVAGQRIDHRVRLTSQTSRVLMLEMQPPATETP